MSNFTPGPWRVEKGVLGKSLIIKAGLSDFNEETIVYVWKTRTKTEQRHPLGRHNGVVEHVSREVPIKNADANARLIAACPDLLEAAKLGRQKLATYTGVYPGDKELRYLLEQWDAAIAKATGEGDQ